MSNCNFKQRLKGLFDDHFWLILYTSEIFTLNMFYKFVCESSADKQATNRLLYNVENNLTSISTKVPIVYLEIQSIGSVGNQLRQST